MFGAYTESILVAINGSPASMKFRPDGTNMMPNIIIFWKMEAGLPFISKTVPQWYWTTIFDHQIDARDFDIIFRSPCPFPKRLKYKSFQAIRMIPCFSSLFAACSPTSCLSGYQSVVVMGNDHEQFIIYVLSKHLFAKSKDGNWICYSTLEYNL